jgi:hypothetical protein
MFVGADYKDLKALLRLLHNDGEFYVKLTEPIAPPS